VDAQEFRCDLRGEKARSLSGRSAKVMERKVYSLTELDQEHPITFLLIWRKYNDTSEVVVIIGHLFLSQVGVGYELDQVRSTSYL